MNFNGAGNGGYDYSDFGKVAGVPEFHADGEIWHQTLWQLRQALIAPVRRRRRRRPRADLHHARHGAVAAAAVDDRHAQRDPAGGDRGHGGRRPVRRLRRHRRAVERVRDRAAWATSPAALDGNDVTPVANFSLPPAPGAHRDARRGTVTLTDGGGPAAGARVEIGGHNSGLASDLAATTDGTGAYSIANVPNGTYPYVFAGGPGYDRVRTNNVAVNGATTHELHDPPQLGAGRRRRAPSTRSRCQTCPPTAAARAARSTARRAQGWGSTSPTSTPGPERREVDHDQAGAADHADAVRGRSRRDVRRRRQRVGRQLQDRDLDERHGFHPDQRRHVHRRPEPPAQPARPRRAARPTCSTCASP